MSSTSFRKQKRKQEPGGGGPKQRSNFVTCKIKYKVYDWFKKKKKKTPEDLFLKMHVLVMRHEANRKAASL